MFHFDKENPNVLFGDIRNESLNFYKDRVLDVRPDLQIDFRSMPFEDETFHLVVFDPPHLVRAGPKSYMAMKYGKLSDSWRDDMRKGFTECFRVLKTNGTLIFKWNEYQVPLKEILALTEHKPVVGHKSGKHSKTHWLTFFKYRKEGNKNILKLLDDRLEHLRDLLSEKEQKYSTFPDPYVEGCMDTLDMVIQCFEGLVKHEE